VTTCCAVRDIDSKGRPPLALCGYPAPALFMPLAAAGLAFLTGVPKIAMAMAGISAGWAACTRHGVATSA